MTEQIAELRKEQIALRDRVRQKLAACLGNTLTPPAAQTTPAGHPRAMMHAPGPVDPMVAHTVLQRALLKMLVEMGSKLGIPARPDMLLHQLTQRDPEVAAVGHALGPVNVERALLVRSATDPSGEIIRLESGGLPWRNHLYDLERVHGIPDDRLVKFVLYTDTAGMWRVQAVTVEGRGFENRLGLPEEWRGVRDEELAKISGIAGARFCHAAGFIGGNETFEGALEMAKEALRRR